MTQPDPTPAEPNDDVEPESSRSPARSRPGDTRFPAPRHSGIHVKPETAQQPLLAADAAARPSDAPESRRQAAPRVSDPSVWERRAAWLEAEAKLQADAAARSRLLLAASEVRALLGASREARRLAQQAARGSSAPAPALAVRQARALCQAQGDVSSARKLLARERSAATSPVLSAHAHYMGSLLERVVQRDEASAEVCLDGVETVDPTDVRVTLQRLAGQLGRDAGPPDVRIRPDDALRPLRQAVGRLRSLRGAEAPRAADDDSSALRLVEARRALARQQLERAAEALGGLKALPGLKGAVQWLMAAWHGATQRPEHALFELRHLVRLYPGRLERRALALRALALDHAEALREALGPGDDAGAAFSEGERACLLALTGQQLERALPADVAHRPLAAALSRFTGPTTGQLAAPSRSEADYELAQHLAQCPRWSDLEQALPPDDHPWSIPLRLERARETGDLAELGRWLPELAAGAAELALARYVSAVLLERAGDLEAAHSRHREALPSPCTREAAVRALASAPDAAALLRSLSAHTNEPTRRAVLLTEALFRLGIEALEYDALAEEARRLEPELPLAYAMAELAARMRGDRHRVRRWLERQQALASGSDDFALASVRTALLLAQTDSGAAARVLEELVARDGTPDLALSVLREEIGQVPPHERAEFRRRAAERASPRRRQQLLSEAVAAYEAAGEEQSAIDVAAELASPLGALWLEERRMRAGQLRAVVMHWKTMVEGTADAELAREACDRLARLELARGAWDEAVAWQRSVLERRPGCPTALRFFEVHGMAAGQEAELEGVATQLTQLLPARDAEAHAFVAARLRIARGTYADTRGLAERVRSLQPAPLWALRLLETQARAAFDDRTLLDVQGELLERSGEPLDVVALACSRARAAARLGFGDVAAEALARAQAALPEQVMVAALHAEHLASRGQSREAAEAFEALAAQSHSKPRQVDALYRAGVLWLDEVRDPARASSALKRAAAIDCPHPGLWQRLQALHAEKGDFEGLAELLEQRRIHDQNARELVDLQVAQASALARAGHLDRARQVLDDVLARWPTHPEALQASAETHLRSRDATGAERDFQALLRAAPSVGLRLAAKRGLASLYEKRQADPERLEGIYRSIIEDDADDPTVRRRLVRVLCGSGRLGDAAGEQRALVHCARSDEERRQYLLELVELLERAQAPLGDAAAVLEQARRTWPDSARLLSAEVQFYERHRDAAAARVALERAINRSRNAIHAGRLEPGLFRLLEVATRLSGDMDGARAAQAGLAALKGSCIPLPALGGQAGQLRFDDLLAPAPLSVGFRRLLYGAGAALERAYGADPRSFEGVAAPDSAALDIRRAAALFGFENARVLVSPRLRFDCRCVYAEPIYVIVGEELFSHDDPRPMDFLLLRALKLAQANACALADMSATELWSSVTGFLACFAPPWPAEGSDAQRLVAARNRIRPHVTAALGPELTRLTAALGANLVPQVAQVADALWRWASRVALLGTGDLGLALDVLWRRAHPDSPPPRERAARIRWVASHAEARDLVSYGVSEAYMEARRRAGLNSVGEEASRADS